MISRYKEKLPKGGFLRSIGGLTANIGVLAGVDGGFWGGDSAYQMPTSKRPSNAQDAASG
jgi:hypothetical protein